MSDDLLPPNATPQERALSDSAARIDEVDFKTNTMWNPQTCPANLLPWLAWAFSVDEWNDNWSEQQKRDVIAASFEIHQTKGTIGSVKRAISSLGYSISVSEWFDYGGDPYTFRIDVGINDEDITAQTVIQLQKVVDSAKNARSHLQTVSLNTAVEGTVYAAAGQVNGLVYRVYPQGTELTEQQIDNLELAIFNMGRIA